MDSRKLPWEMVGLALAVLLLAGCGRAPPELTTTPMPPTVAPVTIETCSIGEPVTFTIDDTIYVCEDELPYAIFQITESGERGVMLQHSCHGFIGAGVDQYCENGQVNTVEVIFCSDAIFCQEVQTRETFTWDQQEYVEISEECADETIHREIKQQVPAGKYQLRIQYLENEQVKFRAVKELMITAHEFDRGELIGATAEEAVSRFLESWVIVSYRNEQIEVLEDDGTASRVRVVAEFRRRTGSGWITKETIVECQKRDEGWLCDRYSGFQPLPQPVVSRFEYPLDGQTIDYTGDYSFKVEPVEGADGYLWGFFQNGEMVWENKRDEQQLSGNEYEILAGSEAHSKFVPGELEVWVRATVNGQWTDAITVIVTLR